MDSFYNFLLLRMDIKLTFVATFKNSGKHV